MWCEDGPVKIPRGTCNSRCHIDVCKKS